MTVPSAAVHPRRSWWQRLRAWAFDPPVLVCCSRCGNVLGKLDGNDQPWLRGEQRRIECFGQANIAGPNESPLVVCIKLDHIRFYA